MHNAATSKSMIKPYSIRLLDLLEALRVSCEKGGDRDVDIIFHAGHEIVHIQVLVIVVAAIRHVAFGLKVETDRQWISQGC